MIFEIGFLCAFAALLFWGFGDFLIQRSARKFGDWETLFIITFFGTIILLPFIYNSPDLALLDDKTFFLLTGVSIVMLLTAILDFEALKKGKIAVVEPIYALEVPITAVLAFLVINEAVEIFQAVLIVVLIAGLVLVSLKSRHFEKKKWIEKGVILAAVGTIFMGLVNFLVGFGSRVTNPLLTNWFINIFLATICIFYIMSHKRLTKLVGDFNANKKLLLTVSTFDNLAWIAFAISATTIPIAISIAISESYIALAALLGFLLNKEILMRHQKFGLVLALASGVALAILTA